MEGTMNTRAKWLAAAAGATAALAMMPGLASAGKPSSGTISVPDGVYAGQVTATVSGSGTWVQARCYQDGVLVYGQGRKLDSAGQTVLTLGPTGAWTGGSANCTAEAGNYARNNSWRVTARTTFHVAAE